MSIGSIFNRILGKTPTAKPNAAPAAPAPSGPVDRVQRGVDAQLVNSLMTVQQARKVPSERPAFDVENTRFGVEIEVAAPAHVANCKTPATADQIKHLMDKGYKFTVDGAVVRNEGKKLIEGGKPVLNPEEVIKIVADDPSRIISTDPNTGEHHRFDDTPDPEVNRSYFNQYANFKTFMEDKVRPAMDKINWIAEDTADCQAHAGVAEAIRYIEVKNNPSTIAGGGKEDIHKAMEFLKEIGCSVHDACALQYHIDFTWMPRDQAMRTQQNLVKLELENENILYRIAQNGQSQHRGVQNGFLFCLPLSQQPITPMLHVDNPDDMKKFWYNELFPGGELKDDPAERPSGPYHHSRYHGLNFHSYWYRGTVEYRYPGTSLDPDVADAHLDTAMGLVAAAYNGDADWKGVHPLGWQPGTSNKDFQVANQEPVSSEQMTRFLDRTVGDRPTRKKVVELFLESGGKVKPGSDTDPQITQTGSLMQKGYQFTSVVSDLDKRLQVSDPVEAVEGVRKFNNTLEVKGPDAATTIIHNAEELNGFLMAH